MSIKERSEEKDQSGIPVMSYIRAGGAATIFTVGLALNLGILMIGGVYLGVREIASILEKEENNSSLRRG